jgi:GntR family transcriptional regulator
VKKLAFDFRPDVRAASPLYLQLAQRLAQAIRDGRYQADEALPSERVLSESLQLSRVTARKAIDQLVEQGLVVRRRGSGNYIAPKLEQPLSRLTSFSEELHQRGFTPSSRWLARSITSAAPDEQLSLGLSTGSRVVRLERLRLADDVVMAYEMTVLPENVLPDPMQVDASLYAFLALRGKAPVRALQHIRALNAEPQLADRLEVPRGQAVLFITRVGYLESGQPVELTHSYCRSDYYGFVAEMRRDTTLLT